MPSLIGIDIGDRFVKIVQLEQRAKLHLRNAFFFPTPGAGSSQKLKPDEFLRQIIERIPLADFKSALVGINIPSSLVTVMVVALPKMGKKEVEIAAVAEAKRKMVPSPGPDSIFEYMMLREVITGTIPRNEVLVVKTEKGYVDGIIDLFLASCGVAPFLISPTPYTFVNLFPANSPVYKKDTAFVDLGYQTINISIAKQGKLQFYRNVKFGLKDIIGHIAAALNIAADKAEAVIKEKGIPQIDVDLSDRVVIAEEIMRQKYEVSQAAGAEQGVNMLELRMLWQTELERVVHEVRRTLAYYKEQSEGNRVENIYFLGGGAKINGMVPVLTKEIGGTCELLPPFEHLEIDIAQDKFKEIKDTDSLFAPAMSVALTIPLARKKEGVIDFLPYNFKQQRQAMQKQLIGVFTGAVVLGIAILTWVNLLFGNNVLRMKKNELDADIKKAKDIIERLDNLKKEQRSVDEKSQKVLDLMSSRQDFTGLIKKIGQLTPDEIFFTDVFIGNAKDAPSTGLGQAGGTGIQGSDAQYKIVITANCLADYEGAANLAYKFKEKLEKRGGFSQVAIKLPALETIKPAVSGAGNIILTENRVREFYIQIDLPGVTASKPAGE